MDENAPLATADLLAAAQRRWDADPNRAELEAAQERSRLRIRERNDRLAAVDTYETQTGGTE